MVDFISISTRKNKSGIVEIFPKFIIKRSSDLMIRGGDFYAIWLEDRRLWSTDEQDAIQLIDRLLEEFKDKYQSDHPNVECVILHLWDASSGMIDSWHKYCQKQMRDSFHMLDEKLIFSNTEIRKKDYASKFLNYPLEEGPIEAWDKLISTLYSEEERHKIEWSIGSIVSGDSKKLQKFLVLYGAAGTGKSTILNVIQQLFDGYYSVFDAKALGSANNSFALEAFKTNPLVAIQHDGDLSRIEDNTRLNSLVSHELMTVNEKFKSTYANKFKAFLFMGTNKPVKITDARSGLIRRLIDVTPSGNKLGVREYKQAVKQVEFELGGIAKHCLDVYLENPNYYDDYQPTLMMGASNDFYNFVLDMYTTFAEGEGVTLKSAWEAYKNYCDDARVTYPLPQRLFKEEMRNYFEEYLDRFVLEDGTRVRSFFRAFKAEKMNDSVKVIKKEDNSKHKHIEFNSTESIFDNECSDCLAQYANEVGTPTNKWVKVKTKLSDISTNELHYVKVPDNHIVIDFDITDETGQKSFERNLEEASKWPSTYAELSKSGSGIHLHYIYKGDPAKLSSIYADHIEVKVFTGGSALRRKLTKCNDVPIATISSGLPMKGEKMVNFDAVKSEKGLRALVRKNLNKEIHPGTKPSIDFIYKILDDAYKSGLHYDISDMESDVLAFAANSTNQSEYCVKLVCKMKFKSEEASEPSKNEDAPLIFYDVEVFPNLFLVNWKKQGAESKVVRMINPKPAEIEELMRFRLVGFNNRRYDNHILYARMMGFSNEGLYDLSQRIISGDSEALMGEAHNVSYTDVYDFAAKKQSLKKWEIELGIHHQELGLPWDEPVPEELWPKVAEYCDNDVIATEAVFDHCKGDFTARQILADLAGLTVNDTTNTLTTKIIFGNDRKPQGKFNYRDMGDVSKVSITTWPNMDVNLDYTQFDKNGKPIFPGYSFERGKSVYRGEEVGEGGYVYAEPGIYGNVALLDVASMHPASIIAEQLFGEEYTKRFQDIRDARVAIKHKDFKTAREMLDGKLAPYLEDESTAGDLAQALKIAINSVYGLTAAKFPHPFKDPRNNDNIVAKRGALFMVNLKHEVQRRGFTVAHIKTDSIKVPDATPELINFIMEYGKMYGYTFEHEATYDRMCLVNDAVYIAKYASEDKCKELYGYAPGDNVKKGDKWTATGTQFAVPYVFKTLFSHEDICFEDLCETKSVKTSLYLDMNEDLPDVTELEKALSKLEDKYKKGELSDTTFEKESTKLVDDISKGHAYQFIGKVGQFCPIKEGCGGGVLVRDQNGKWYSVTGTKGYRWLESEMVKTLAKEDDIDRSYYDKLVDDAKTSIMVYGDIYWFVSDDPYIPPSFEKGDIMDHPCYEESLPWD